MNCCCSQYKYLGCFLHCEEIDTELTPGVGTFDILLDFNGRTKVYEQTLGEGETIVLLPEWVNEYYRHTFQIVDSDGDIWTDEDGNDCFTFKTK